MPLRINNNVPSLAHLQRIGRTEPRDDFDVAGHIGSIVVVRGGGECKLNAFLACGLFARSWRDLSDTRGCDTRSVAKSQVSLSFELLEGAQVGAEIEGNRILLLCRRCDGRKCRRSESSTNVRGR